MLRLKLVVLLPCCVKIKKAEQSAENRTNFISKAFVICAEAADTEGQL